MEFAGRVRNSDYGTEWAIADRLWGEWKSTSFRKWRRIARSGQARYQWECCHRGCVRTNSNAMDRKLRDRNSGEWKCKLQHGWSNQSRGDNRTDRNSELRHLLVRFNLPLSQGDRQQWPSGAVG